MAGVNACLDTSAVMMEALRYEGNLDAVLPLLGAMSPDQIALTVILFRTEPKDGWPGISNLDAAGRKGVRAALRAALHQVCRDRAASALETPDETLGEVGPREIMDLVCGRLPAECDARTVIEVGIARNAAVLQLVHRVSKAVPEPTEADLAAVTAKSHGDDES